MTWDESEQAPFALVDIGADLWEKIKKWEIA